jgi:hypothetical protein
VEIDFPYIEEQSNQTKCFLAVFWINLRQW